MRAPPFVLPAVALALVACSSQSNDVCQDIGDCSQRGDNDWIATCQGNAKELSDEAAGIGCTGVFNQYYACAASNYSCQGATATFPGCDQALTALDDCIATATVDTSCANLAVAEARDGYLSHPHDIVVLSDAAVPLARLPLGARR